MSQSYYIYYRTTASAAQVREAVGAMQTALAHESGVGGRLLRRVDGSGTWMEVYEDVPDPERFELELAAAVVRFGLRSLLAPGAERHVEQFTAD